MTERYNAVWRNEAAMLGTEWAAHALIYSFFLERAATARTLDLCCGTGAGSSMILASRGVPVVGVDYSEEALAFARERNPGPTYVRLDLNYELAGLENLVRELGLLQCFCVEGVEHLLDPEAAIAIVLSGGVKRIFVSTPVEAEGAEPVGFHVTPFTPDRVREFQARFDAKLLGYMAPVELEKLAELLARASPPLLQHYFRPPGTEPCGNYLFQIDAR